MHRQRGASAQSWVYGWLVLGTVWYLQVETCSACPGITILLAWVLLLSFLRGVVVIFATRSLVPPAQELAMGPTPSLGTQNVRSGAVLAATRTQIDSLPLVKFSCATCSDGFCSGCSVCLADFEDDDAVRRLPCGHDFHQSCIDVWLLRNKRCPLCMRGIDDHVGPRQKKA